MTQPVFRFAPSPNGRLHLGHAYSAILNANLAAGWNGRFLLRIEDIDPTRAKPEFEAGIFEDLAWLGLAWERPVRRQSEHMADYQVAFHQLREMDVVYPCFCTRGQIAAAAARCEADEARPWPRDPDGAPLYPGNCRNLPRSRVAERLALGDRPSWRLAMDAAQEQHRSVLGFRCFGLSGAESLQLAKPERWGDAILLRKETPTSYHLSVVVDDARQGVTHVVRGRDLERATDLHALLQRLLDLPSPAYHHHELVRDEHGSKLSKSLESESLAALRARGVSPAQIRARLGFAGSVPVNAGG